MCYYIVVEYPIAIHLLEETKTVEMELWLVGLSNGQHTWKGDVQWNQSREYIFGFDCAGMIYTTKALLVP